MYFWQKEKITTLTFLVAIDTIVISTIKEVNKLGKISKKILPILMILNGLLFVSNIVVLGNREAAIKMHYDLAPTASALITNIKVIDCLVVGILYIICAYGIMQKKIDLVWAGIIGTVLFVGLYGVEVSLWGSTHPDVWTGLATFGTLSLVFGIYSYWHIAKETKNEHL